MTTPYGTTGFSHYEDSPASALKFNEGVTRAIKIINPDTSTEIYALFNKNTNSAPASYPDSEVPAYIEGVGGVTDTGQNATDDRGRMYVRNSFYWGRQQCAALSTTSLAALNSLGINDFLLGRMSHWMLGADGVNLSSEISMTQDPSPDGVTPGQKTWDIYPWAYGYQLGTGVYADVKVSAVFRLMPDGTTWCQNFGGYNSYAQPMWISTSATEADGSVGLYSINRGYFALNYSQVYAFSGGSVTNTWTASGLNYFYKPGTSWYIRHVPDESSVTGTRTDGNGNSYTVTTTYPHWSTMEIQGRLGEIRTVFFNGREQVTGTIEPTGLTTTNYYGSDGFLSQSTAFESQATSTYTFTNGLLATKVNPLGLATHYSWDKLERLTGISYPDNTTVSNVYNRLDLAAQKDRLGHWAYASYDNLRQMYSFTDRNTNTTHLTYCQCGGLESITDPQTNITTYNRNLVGWVNSIIFADANNNQTTRIYTRDILGRATNVLDSSGLSLDYIYNMQGLATNISSSQGTVFVATYNDANWPVTIRNAEGVWTTNNYDVEGRIKKRDYPTGISQQYDYDYNTGLLTWNMDGLNHQTTYGYDPAGRLISLTDANYNTNGFTYNPAGQIATLADGNGHVTSWAYDAYGRNISKTDANNVLVETNGYDANGRLVARWTPAKGLTHYTYDNNGNPRTIAYNSGPNITATFDSLNHITALTDAVGASAFTYKNFGAFMSALASEDGPWPSDTVMNTYGSNHKLALQTLAQPSGNWTKNLTYDSTDLLMRVKTITTPAGTFTYDYYGVGREIQSLALPGGNTIAETYDDAGQLLTTALKHGSTVLDSYGYAYDAGGNRTSVQRAGGAHVDYGYDNIGQLTSAVGYEPDGTTVRGNENFGYSYDPAGNLATRNNNTLIQTFTTGNANQLTNISRNNLLTVAGSLTSSPNGLSINDQDATIYNDLTFAATNGVAINDGLNIFTAIVTTASNTMTNSLTKTLPASVNFAYDLNGNLTSDGLHGYDYDCANQLTRITVTNSWKTEYMYDGFGRRRIRKEYVWQSSQWLTANEVHYIYDGMLVLQERNAINVPMVTYTRGNDLSGTMQRAGGIGGLLARTDANGSAFYHDDANGNITALVNSSGSLVAKYLYDSFGNLIAKSGSLADVNTYRFSSKELDLRSGLYYYGFRFYDPNFQRWPNHDPIGERGGINLYGYVGNNPINFVDPLGLTTVTSPDWFPGATDVSENGDFTKVVNDGSDATTVLERLTQEQLREEEQRTADRLKNFEKEWCKKDRRAEGSFDTRFFPKVNHYFYVQDMDRIYAWNEINYLGIGMYERWLGDSKLSADILTLGWKTWNYPGAPIPSGTWYWLHRGYDDYPNMGSGSSGGSSGSSGGRR
jgi:RHS repeat-associated protein